MKKLKGKTQIKSGKFYDSKGNQFITLQDAMANDTKCGCGVNCKEGFVSLPNFNSSSGDKEGFRGFYIVDGELVVDTISNIRSEISNFCNGGGDGGEPQALRLTFDNIENANLLVGDASNVADWNTFFDLPTYGNPFTSVEVVGNEVRLFGGSNIEVKIELFAEVQSLIEVDDQAGSIVALGESCFGGCGNLISVNLPALTSTVYTGENLDYGTFGSCMNLTSVSMPIITELADYVFYDCRALININIPNLEIAGDGVFDSVGQDAPELILNFPSLITAGNSCFINCTSLTTVNFPSLITAGNNCFVSCSSLTSVNFLSLTTAGSFCFANCGILTSVNLPLLTNAGSTCFANCTGLNTINIPLCTDLGSTTGDDEVFKFINGNTITLTVPAALMTADSGSPDGDIVYLQANNTVTVITT